jgi:hypothetical protein
MHRGTVSRLARKFALIAVVGTMMLAPAAAFAQSSSVSGYGGKGGETVGVSQSNDPTNPGSPSTSSGSGGGGVLPFTGLDVGFLLGGGLLLVAVGAALARFRPHGETTS